MAILKSAPRPPKNETLQLRMEESVKLKLEKYAEFINSSESYVVSEALKLLFRKDEEFKAWLEKGHWQGDRPQSEGAQLLEAVKNETPR
jgi:predicted transcriptional regulator